VKQQKAAEYIKYEGAGTVEFLDKHRTLFYGNEYAYSSRAPNTEQVLIMT
jgi:acetyl/propionyl-CoA carboxylase alpha subunit